MLESPRLRRVIAAVALSLLVVPLSGAGPADAHFAFYALYHRVADHESLQLIEIQQSALSRDGSRLILYGLDPWRRLALVTMRADGSDLTRFDIADIVDALWDICIDGDGSQAFFRHHWDRAIYRFRDARLEKIFDADAHATIQGVDEIRATADGRWVYLRDGRSAIWRLPADGGQPERVVAIDEVQRREGRPANLGPFRVSADGTTLLFRVDGFWDAANVFHLKHELFLLRGGAVRQLTDHPGHADKSVFALSGDGTTVAYAAGPPLARWIARRVEADTEVDLGPVGQVNGAVLDLDGSRLFYADDRANGGRLVDPGSGVGVDLFPRYNVATIPLGAVWSLAISDSGDRLSFRFGDGVYVGHIGRPRAVPGAPVIEALTLEPPLGTATASSGAVLRARVADTEGPGDLVRSSVNGLIDGFTQRQAEQAAVFFSQPPNDAGHPPDATAADGLFGAVGMPGRTPAAAAATRVRFAVMDAAGSVAVADAGGAGGALRPGSELVGWGPDDGSGETGTANRDDGRGPGQPTGGEPPHGGGVGGEDAGSAAAGRTVEEVVAEFDRAWSLPDRESLGGARAEVQAALGWPQAFTIYYAEDAGGSMRRYESWTYFAHRTVFNFIGDELLDSEEIADGGGAFLPAARYRPTHFVGEMSEQEVRSLLGDLVEVELPAELGDGLRYLGGDQILLGFSPGGLEFVETLAVAAAEGES